MRGDAIRDRLRPVAFARPTHDPLAFHRESLRHAAIRARESNDRARRARARLRTETANARTAGMSMQQIADTTGLTKQAVQRLIEGARRERMVTE